MNELKVEPKMLRLEESARIHKSVNDQVTSQLLDMATTCVMRKFLANEKLPTSDFDMVFFTEVMLDFCTKHSSLSEILAGANLRWFDEDEV